MMDAITSSLPMAMAILVSSVPLMAVTLILVAQHRWPPALAFLSGWAGGLAVVGGLTLVLSQQSAAAGERGAVAWMGLLRAGVGVLLLVLAWRQWRARPREPGAATLPKWMDMVESLSTPKALGLGFALVAVNPKNLMLTVSGAMAIAASEATRSAHWVALGIFGLVATAGVASPVLVHWAAGERSAAVLAAMKNWIVRNNAVIVSAVLLLLGAVLLNKGFGQMAQMHQLQGLPLR